VVKPKSLPVQMPEPRCPLGHHQYKGCVFSNASFDLLCKKTSIKQLGINTDWLKGTLQLFVAVSHS